MISWIDFEKMNPNTTDAFESMCRCLFSHNICKPGTILHSNPNNPGIEVEPVIGKNNQCVSFQAKFFSSEKINYPQIRKSFEKIIDEDEDKLDEVYLYCNKDVSVQSKAYRSCEKVLLKKNIKLIPITNQTILHQVEADSMVKDAFFGLYTLDFEWFQNNIASESRRLGKRYNANFNVKTQSEKNADIFCQNNAAINALRERMSNALARCRSYYSSHKDATTFVSELQKDLIVFLKSNPSKVGDFLQHQSVLKRDFFPIYEQLKKVESNFQKKVSDLTIDPAQSFEKQEIQRKAVREYRQNAHEIAKALDIFDCAILTEYEQCLANAKILLVQGAAGTGKSQMFAHLANDLIQNDKAGLLLIGSSFLQRTSVQKQILENLQLDNLEFSSFLNVLEFTGEQQQQPVVVFIDAINESCYKDIWQNAISQLTQRLEKYSYVRFAFSFRSGYEPQLLSNDMDLIAESKSCVQIIHNGFTENTDEAIDTFLNFYGIPFTPSIYFYSEAHNPLYLMLFCEVTNDGSDNLNISELFQRLLKQADREANKAVGITPSIHLMLVNSFLNELVQELVKKQEWLVDQHTLLNFQFWQENGIVKKWDYISTLVRANVLIECPYKSNIYYQISYNLLQDYLVAQHIVAQCSNGSDVCVHCVELLAIKDGYIKNSYFLSAIPFVCELCFEKYHQDCIIDLLTKITNSYDVDEIAEQYVNSFSLRSQKNICENQFVEFINAYHVDNSTVFSVLISNATKSNHPLNAHFLDKNLFNWSIADRDSCWTATINDETESESRIMQLIKKFDQGFKDMDLPKEQIWLLLLLFSWILTSSNRCLRDKCSKAMIEILKTHFDYCLKLLKHFENVNDPYVIQRLYAIVFGAVMKRTSSYTNEFMEISLYVYRTIFLAEEVYPDILLRDYARLIIERWLFENPNQTIFDIQQIRPPYNSADIPQMPSEDPRNNPDIFKRCEQIIFSMAPDCPPCSGVSGDFGQYVFQPAIQEFQNTDTWNTYLYAMDYIINILGYNDFLASYDSRLAYYDRHDVKKVERIGKKYQWIAFYNALAKIADHHDVGGRWGENSHEYRGPWEPFVRDFDPTINENFLYENNAPNHFQGVSNLAEFLPAFQYDDQTTPWLKAKPALFDLNENKIIMQDDVKQQWVVLSQAQHVERTDFSLCQERQIIWYQAKANFCKTEDFTKIKASICEKNFRGHGLSTEHAVIYQIYNREQIWSPSVPDCIGSEWQAYEVETGEFETTEIEIPYVDMGFDGQSTEELLSLLDPEDDILEDVSLESMLNAETSTVNSTIPDIEHQTIVNSISKLNPNDNHLEISVSHKTIKKPIKRIVGMVLPAYHSFLWSMEYDASQETTQSFRVPCNEIFEFFNLHQKEADGYFYAGDTLVAFDSKSVGNQEGLIIRKDYLNQFISEKGYTCFWTLMGEKQFCFDTDKQVWSEWSGFAYFEKGEVIGNMECKEIHSFDS